MNRINAIARSYELDLRDFLVLSAVAKGPWSRSDLVKTVMWLRVGWKELDDLFDRISHGVAPEEEFNPSYFWVEPHGDGSGHVEPHTQAMVVATSEERIATALRNSFFVAAENIEAKQVGRHVLIREFWWQMPVRGAEYHVTFDRKPVAQTVITDLLVTLMWAAKHGNGRAAKRISFYLEKGAFPDENFVSSVKAVWPEIHGPEWKNQLLKVLGS